MRREREPESFGALGWAVIILSTALGVGWMLGLLAVFSPSTAEASPEVVQLLNGIGQVLAGALAAFLGSNIRSKGQSEGAATRSERSPTHREGDSP